MKLAKLVDVGQQTRKPSPTVYVRVHRTRITHLIPASANWHQNPLDKEPRMDLHAKEFYAIPITEPMAVVDLSLSKEKGKGGYPMTSDMLGSALEIGHKTSEEWISELCPQYTGFPTYETEEELLNRSEAYARFRKKITTSLCGVR